MASLWHLPHRAGPTYVLKCVSQVAIQRAWQSMELVLKCVHPPESIHDLEYEDAQRLRAHLSVLRKQITVFTLTACGTPLYSDTVLGISACLLAHLDVGVAAACMTDGTEFMDSCLRQSKAVELW